VFLIGSEVPDYFKVGMSIYRPSFMSRIKKAINFLTRMFSLFEDAMLVLALSILIIISFSQIILREFFTTGIFWGEAASRYLVLWVGLLGAMVATRNDNHITIDIVSKYASPSINSAIRIITDLFTAAVTFILTYYSVEFIKNDMTSNMTAFASVPSWVAGMIIPVAFGVICARYILYSVTHIHMAVTGKFKEEDRPVEAIKE
jgi:TRAP-type C4-dicarboxylate transport system permease small subunit